MHVRLFKPTGPDRVAFVAMLPAQDEAWLVQTASGPSTAKLRDPKLLGPMSREVADQSSPSKSPRSARAASYEAASVTSSYASRARSASSARSRHGGSAGSVNAQRWSL